MYVKATSGTVDTYPYNVGELRRDNPNVSFPKQIPDEMLASYDVYPVVFGAVPDIDERTQKVTRDTQPSLVDGTWTLGWSASSKTAEEIQEYDDALENGMRVKRNGLLRDTDYLALSDNTLTAEMSAYRQALRDITTHSNWPNLADSDWPTKP